MNTIEKAVSVLKEGGIVLHPTETCYGFACDPFDKKALEKLYKLKGRDAKKPLAILVADIEMAQRYGVFDEVALDLAKKFWPGALSIVVPRQVVCSGEECHAKKFSFDGEDACFHVLPDFFNEGEGFVSMRVSSDEFSTNLVKAFGRPLVTTSANLSGEKPIYEVEVGEDGKVKGFDAVVTGEVVGGTVVGMAEGKVVAAELIDFVVDGGKIPERKPSTVVKVENGKATVLRQGEVFVA
jgi:tRNA A37 threonylcarbamoyladenosine synthetase subunit TsaC/SUA5/YrdC